MGNIKVKKIVNRPVDDDPWSPLGLELALRKPEKGISREQAQINIVEWLYINDGKFPNKLDWRTEFLAMVEWNLKHIK